MNPDDIPDFLDIPCDLLETDIAKSSYNKATFRENVDEKDEEIEFSSDRLKLR